MEKKTTFTTRVKEEIAQESFSLPASLAFLSGFIKVNGNLSLSSRGVSISLTSENPKIAKLVYSLIKSTFDIIPQSSYSRKMKLNKATVYGITIQERAMEILEKLELMSDGLPSYPKNIIQDENIRYFISGAFLASGSVNSPSGKNYHLQFLVSSKEDAMFFCKTLNKFKNDRNMDFKYIARGNKYVLYLKKGDQIATFLALIYASNCVLEYEDARIQKDYINNMNRMEICFNANFKKTIEKGEEQLKEINYIISTGNALTLGDKEQKLMQMRLDNPEASLSYFVDLFARENITISRSGVNHLFSKIHEKYQELKAHE